MAAKDSSPSRNTARASACRSPESLRCALVESVVEEAPIALALLDENGEVFLDNREWRKLAADLGAPDAARLLLDTALPDWGKCLLGTASREGFHALELRIDAPSGKAPRWLSCSVLPIAAPDTRSTRCLLLAVNDVSALRQGQEKARLAALRGLIAEEEHAAVLRESLSAALYRLEEPLNVMHSAVGMLRNREPVMSGALALALEEGRARLEELRQLIPLGEHEAVTPVNLNEVLRDVLEVCIPRLLSNGITINWRPTATLPAVLGRPMQLHSLFKALVDNAIEAVSQSGWKTRDIALSTTLSENYVQIAIDDRGPGIPAELRLKAFEPFFTTWVSRSQRHLGTGLSRALQVTAGHGGTLELRDAPGGGCRALVELPVGETGGSDV
ncbi:MAG: nitrogen fixation negative regulator NifL, partial [Azoarcus sp.]|jgi:nitrogen fixation negative regulator NifL|nr:nitrogen fixation negative regulator NifL [Azoarcus sp.]